MIEFPESHNLARQLQERLCGRRVLNVEAAASPHKFAFFNGDPSEYHPLLSGLEILAAEAFAGWVELQFEDEIRLAFHDGVAMSWLDVGVRPPAKHQLLLELDDGSHMVCTVRMYGGLWAFRDGEIQSEYYHIARAKPSPLSEDFNLEYFLSIYEGEKKTISAKAMLATGQRIPGLGNGVLHDILFTAGIHPKRKLSTLTDEDMAGLFSSIKVTLAKMTAEGGRDTEKDIYGDPGGYHTLLSSKTAASPCPVCGGEIVRQAYMGGNVYFCPICQPL